MTPHGVLAILYALFILLFGSRWLYFRQFGMLDYMARPVLNFGYILRLVLKIWLYFTPGIGFWLYFAPGTEIWLYFTPGIELWLYFTPRVNSGYILRLSLRYVLFIFVFFYLNYLIFRGNTY